MGDEHIQSESTSQSIQMVRVLADRIAERRAKLGREPAHV